MSLREGLKKKKRAAWDIARLYLNRDGNLCVKYSSSIDRLLHITFLSCPNSVPKRWKRGGIVAKLMVRYCK